jgi:magnesium transporter
MSRRGKHRLTGVRYPTPGTAPGTLNPPDWPSTSPTRVTIIDYGPDHLTERHCERFEEILEFRDTPSVTWINIEGLHDVELLRSLGAAFGFHPLTLEDVLNCGQRPKVESYGAYHFMVLKSLRLREELEVEQISFFLSGNYIITLQEVPGDSFEAVRQRIRQGKGLIRKAGPDYLAYALIDALIDEFFPVLESYGERIEELESELVLRPSPAYLRTVYKIKRELLVLRRMAWPEREVINALQRDESKLIHPDTQVFLRDCYDHTVQVIDMIETYRDLAAGMLDVYLSSTSNRMNEIMKVLTVISTIFIPLNFIAGVYGMNFDPQRSPFNMPELEWRYGYLAVLSLMASVAIGLIFFFRRKGWFRSSEEADIQREERKKQAVRMAEVAAKQEATQRAEPPAYSGGAPASGSLGTGGGGGIAS